MIEVSSLDPVSINKQTKIPSIQAPTSLKRKRHFAWNFLYNPLCKCPLFTQIQQRFSLNTALNISRPGQARNPSTALATPTQPLQLRAKLAKLEKRCQVDERLEWDGQIQECSRLNLQTKSLLKNEIFPWFCIKFFHRWLPNKLHNCTWGKQGGLREVNNQSTALSRSHIDASIVPRGWSHSPLFERSFSLYWYFECSQSERRWRYIKFIHCLYLF